MISNQDFSDITQLMKMNRFALVDGDTAHLEFAGVFSDKSFSLKVLAAENEPQVALKCNDRVIFSRSHKSIEELKIFLDEKLYLYLNPTDVDDI